MACEREQFTKLIEQKNLRATEARCRILELLHETHEHYTPEEMLEALRERGKPLSIATLYQNLAKLADAGLIARIVGPDGHTRYDVNTLPHHHLVCKVCGRMLDVGVEGPLQDLRPVALYDDEEDPATWRLGEVHLEFHGVCPACQARLAEAAEASD
ncbi:Fur family transcriptional regulator [Oceanithermus sp.]